MHLTRWDWPHTIRDMSSPDIGTLAVRFSPEERRLLEDFARVSGMTIEELIREALFLPPIEPRARRHLRIVHGNAPDRAAAAPVVRAGAAGWPSIVGAAPTMPASPAAAQSD
jgi:hypothetical protein